MNAYTATVLEAWPSEIEGPDEPATLEPTTKHMPPSAELAHAWAEMIIADGLADVENIDLLSRTGLRGAPLPLTQLAIPLDPHAQVEQNAMVLPAQPTQYRIASNLHTGDASLI